MGEDKSSLFSLQIWHQSLARNLEPEKLKGCHVDAEIVAGFAPSHFGGFYLSDFLKLLGYLETSHGQGKAGVETFKLKDWGYRRRLQL